MTIGGPVPKPADQRQRRNAELFPTQVIRWDGKRRGPDLPKDIGITWCPMAQKWWDTWRDSPNAMIMTETDWIVMFETAVLVNEYWTPRIVVNHRQTKGEPKFLQSQRPATELTNLAKEIRTRLAAFGGTYEDRRKLRLEFITDATEQAYEESIQATATQGISYLEKMNQAVATKKATKKNAATD